MDASPEPTHPYDPNTHPGCTWWWNNDGEVSCKDLLGSTGFGITIDDLLAWNPSLTPECGNFILGRSYCVEVRGWEPPSTTTDGGPSPTDGSGGIKTPQPTQPDMVDNCNKFDFVEKGKNCASIAKDHGITVAQFVEWNPSVKSDCTELWLGVNVCVGVVGFEPPTTTKPPTSTTVPGNGIETPEPTQPGMVDNCEGFDFVNKGDTCAIITKRNGITLAQLVLWNPSIESDCTGLWLNVNVCVKTIGFQAPTTTNKPPTTTTGPGNGPPANGISTPMPIQTGMVSNCNKFHEIKSTTTCANLLAYHSITMAQLYAWNPAVKSDCSGLLVGTNACVGVIGGSPPTTTKPPANGISTPQPIQTGMVTNCNSFHEIKSTTTCAALLDYRKITMAQLYAWNPAVKSDCSNLQPGTNVCVGIIGGSTPPTTTKPPANGITTPLPIQTGMVTNCNKFHEIKSTTTCANLLAYHSITMPDLYKWNPAVKSDCSNLQPGTNVCVGVIGGSSTQPPANGVTTPLPIQTGMVTNCKTFHEIKSTTTCAALLDYRKITMAQLYKWNPAVKSDCSNLLPGTNVCVAVLS
ncbi:hypothetical protein CC79DRAFT_1378678 [Sarocladium strictum]